MSKYNPMSKEFQENAKRLGMNGYEYMCWLRQNGETTTRKKDYHIEDDKKCRSEERSKKKRGPKPIPEKIKKFGIDRRSVKCLLGRSLLTSKEIKRSKYIKGICKNCGQRRSHKRCRIYLNKYNSSYQKASFIESCKICHKDLEKMIESLHENGKKFKPSNIRKMIIDGDLAFRYKNY